MPLAASSLTMATLIAWEARRRRGHVCVHHYVPGRMIASTAVAAITPPRDCPSSGPR